MEKVVFLDRDGVINNPHEHYYVHRIEDFVINEGIVEGLQSLRDQGFKFVVITNQGGISKGEFSVEDVDKLHTHMLSEFSQHGIEFLAIYYCPHHDTIEKCLCRKPEPLMLEKAISRFNIDLDQSWFIGDKQSDIDAGTSAGVKSILINKNQDIREVLHQIS
jgi:D-glycero-D-manno-heptose 1,7-bisphosphate phosphatase